MRLPLCLSRLQRDSFPSPLAHYEPAGKLALNEIHHRLRNSKLRSTIYFFFILRLGPNPSLSLVGVRCKWERPAAKLAADTSGQIIVITTSSCKYNCAAVAPNSVAHRCLQTIPSRGRGRAATSTAVNERCFGLLSCTSSTHGGWCHSLFAPVARVFPNVTSRGAVPTFDHRDIDLISRVEASRWICAWRLSASLVMRECFALAEGEITRRLTTISFFSPEMAFAVRGSRRLWELRGLCLLIVSDNLCKRGIYYFLLFLRWFR